MTKVGGHGVATVKELLKEKAIIQKFAKPSQIYKEYKPSEAETFFNNPKYKAFYENVVDLGDKGKENMKLVAEELNIDLASLFSLYEYVGSENTLPIIKLTKTSFQEDQSNLMIKPLLPIMVDEQEKVYKVLQQMISIRNMPENVLNQPLSEFVELLTSKHDLLNNLWQDYKEIWKKKAPKAFKTNETQYYLAKSRQQIWILMAIFKGLMTGLFKIDDKMFLDMFKVFKEQQFRGSLSMDLPEVEGSPLQKEITDGFDAVKHMSALLLTASLKLGDILRLNPKQLLSNQSSAYTIVTRTSDEIFKGMAELEEQDFPLTVEVSYFSMAMYTAVDSINLVLSFQQDQILEDMHKRLTDTLRRNNSTSYNSYEKGIDGLFASEVYNFFTPIEKDLVKNCMKDFFTLLIIPKTPGTNVLEKSNDSEIDFIANTIFKIIDTPKDLEEFWSKFDKDFVYGNSMPTVFSNFLDMFPHKAELTIKFATNILGSSRGHIYVQNVIDLFANMSKYTLPEDSEVLKKVQYEELGSHESELPTYVLTEDYEVPNSNGFIIPANTTFIMTETKNIKFSFKYNYWNVFWKSITAILAESVNKNIAFTGAQFKFIKLICKMIMLEPFAASDIQLMMLTPSSDIATLSDARVRETKTRGYAGLAMIFFECLNLCKTSNDNISTVYWIIKAVNSLMISDISTELIVVSQIYPLISQEEQMGGQIHVFASIMEIFRQKYYGRFDKPSNLLAELVQLTETVILKSDYLYENFPPKDYLSHLSQVRVGNDQVEISEIANHYLDMQNGGYWSEEVTKKFNERVFQSARSYIPGSKLYPSTLVPDLLELVLIQAMDLVNNNTAVNFEDCPETRLIIKARVFSILDSLAARFKVGSGAQLLTSRSEGPYICLNYLAEFFKSINFSKFLMSNFDVEINPQDVFFGVREPSEGVNGLGLENKLYLDQVLHSKNQTKTTEAFQTMMVEVTKCFETICQLVLESVRDPTSPAARLTFVAEFKAYLLTVEDFYKNLFSNFSQEYSANFFIMLMALADFNNEKEVNSNLTLKLHSFEMPISSLTPQSLFFMDSTKDYHLMFSHKINQAAILTLGKQEKLLKSNSISTAALHSMYSVLKLWRKANKANKPVLADLLTSGQLSPHFSNKVFEWLHKVLVNHMTSIQSRPSEALQAMKFVGECLISQPTYFNDFVKYCSKHNLNRLKMNGLVYLLHIMVKDLEELSSAEIFEEKTYFECLCQIMQLVAGIYLRPSVRREVIAQLPLHVLPNLSKLAERIIDQRKWFIANIIECAKGTVVENDGNLVFCQDKPLQLTVIMTRIKYAADLECNFCFSLASFMKVLNSHLFDLTRDDFASQAAFSSNNFISSKLYLKIMNYAVEAKRLRLFSFNAALLEMISNRLLAESDGPAVHGFDYAGYFEKPLTINNQETKIDVSSYKESFYDPAWGYAFNQNDTEMKLRESSGNFKYTNTALQYLDLYNILNRICLFGKMLAVETGKNITLMTSTGIEGALLSSSLHVNPSFPPKIVIKNLYRMLPQHGLKAHDAERNIEQMVRFAGSLRDETVSEIEKKLFNPLHEGKLQEWAGNLYGYVGNFLDDLNTFRILADSLTNEIDNIKTLIAEVKKSMENLQSKTFQVNPLYEVLSLLCISASSHLKYLGHLMSNTFYGLPIKSDQDRRDLFETTTKIIASVSAYIYELHSGVQYQRDAPDSEKLAFDNILLSTYYSLFILSHMAEDAGLGAGTHSLNGAIMFVREKIREDSPYLPVAIQTFILLIKILPESLNGSDLTFLLQLINNPGNSSSTYNSICQLLVVAFDSPRIRKIVATAMTLNALVSSKRFIDRASFSQMMYYQGEVREEEFSCWLWTLNLVIHAFKPIKETMGSIDPILSFVKLYMNRILSVLGFQFASLAGQSTFSTPNSDARSRSECFRSTAYIEELDLTMQLMDLLFIESSRWAVSHKSIFDNLIFVMLTRTMLLFEPNQSINEQYLAISWTEKVTEKIKALGMPDKEPSFVEQSSRKPSMVPKATAKKSSFVSDYGRSAEYFDLAGSNNPDLFSFNLEIHLLRIAFHLNSALLEGLDNVDFNSGGATGVATPTYTEYGGTYTHGAFGSTNSTTMATQGMIRFKYDTEFWRQIPDILRSSQQYLAKAIGRMINCQELYSKGVVNLTLVNNSYEFATQSGLTNSIFPPPTTTELHKLGFATMEMVYLVTILIIQNFDSCDKSIKLHATEAIKKCKLAVGASLSDYERINKNTMTVAPREKGSVSLRRQEEDSDEDRSYLLFIRKYFPQNQ